MRAIKSRDTGPERALRKLLHPLAPGYRLNRRALPGTPDVAYGQRKLAIFVHGCFWHGHDCRHGSRLPKTNRAFWRAKIKRNRERDAQALAALRKLGWRTLVIYECGLKKPRAVKARLIRALTRSPRLRKMK